MDEQQPTASGHEPDAVIGQDKKYCMDCGKVILRRAELCPGCGCRQVSAPDTRQKSFRRVPRVPIVSGPQPELQSAFVKQMAILLALNFLWNGLGNLAIGDKRGWSWGFANWIVIGISIFTLWIPAILFFAYCGYSGYELLVEQVAVQASHDRFQARQEQRRENGTTQS
jgi:hypothetical protein